MLRETALKRWGTTRIWFVCSDHWRRLTKAERRVLSRLEKLEKRMLEGGTIETITLPPDLIARKSRIGAAIRRIVRA